MIGLITARSHYPLHSLRLLWRHSSQIMMGQAHVVLNISPILKPTCMETSLSGIACLLVIRQGGYEYYSGTNRRTWYFPITFPHACLSAMNTLMRDGSSGDGNMDTVYNLSKTSLNYRSDNGCGSYRIAIGY